jgi:chemotaxis protein CheC
VKPQIHTPTGPQIDRLCQLAAVGAVSAASAMGRLLDADVAPGAARVLGPGDAAGCYGEFTTIGFAANGVVGGLVAVALHQRVVDAAVEQMVGGAPPGDEMAESALCEFGNIIASQTVSAIADSLGATIMLSVPELVMSEAGEDLGRRIHRRGASLHIETQLVDPSGALLALLVIAPDPQRDGAS